MIIMDGIDNNRSVAEHSDIELLQAIETGQQEALTQLYDRYASQVLAVAFKVIGNRQEAEDLVHDVFIEAWQKANSYDSIKGSVRNWLLLRARSRAIDRIRKLSRIEFRETLEDLELFMHDEHSEQNRVEPSRQLEHQQARQAIDLLSSDHALLIRASYFEGLTYREIAKKYNIPEGTVKSRMLAAFKVLRKHLVQPMEVAND